MFGPLFKRNDLVFLLNNAFYMFTHILNEAQKRVHMGQDKWGALLSKKGAPS